MSTPDRVPGKPALVFSFELGMPEHYRMSRAASMRTRDAKLLTVASVVWLAGILVALPFLGMDRWVALVNRYQWAVGFPLLMVLGMPLLQWYQVVTYRRANRTAGGTHTFTFDAEGLHIRGCLYTVDLPWEQVREVSQTREFLLFAVSKWQVYGLPLRAVGSEARRQALRDFLSARREQPALLARPAEELAAHAPPDVGTLHPPAAAAPPDTSGETISFEVSTRDAYRASRLLMGRTPFFRLMSLLLIYVPLVLALVGVLAWVLNAGWDMQVIAQMVALVIVPPCVLASIAAMHYTSALRWAAEHRGGCRQTVSFTADGLAVVGCLANERLKWEALERAEETRHLILVYFSRYRAYFLPKLALTAQQTAAVRAILREHLGERARLHADG